MPLQREAFSCLNRHVPEIADIDHLFTFQEEFNQKTSSERHCFQRCRISHCISLNTAVKEGIRQEELSLWAFWLQEKLLQSTWGQGFDSHVTTVMGESEPSGTLRPSIFPDKWLLHSNFTLKCLLY